MSCSYSNLEDVWETSRGGMYVSSPSQSSSPSPSPSSSPSMSPSTDGGRTIVFGTDEGYESGGRGRMSPSQSPSEFMLDSHSFVTGGRGTPVSLLDEDDYVSDSGQSTMMSRSVSPSPASIPDDLPGLPPRRQSRPLRTMDAPTRVVTGTTGTTDKKMMRQILRIRDDVREMLHSKGGNSEDTNVLQSFPFIETGLFIAVGLFVLLAMQMMVRLRPTFGADFGSSRVIKNIRLME